MQEIEQKILSFLKENGARNGFRLRIEMEKLGFSKYEVRRALRNLENCQPKKVEFQGWDLRLVEDECLQELGLQERKD